MSSVRAFKRNRAYRLSMYQEANDVQICRWSLVRSSKMNNTRYKIPLREVPREVAQGHNTITLVSLPDAMTIAFLIIVHHTITFSRENNEFAFCPQYFLGVINSSTFSTF